MKQEIKIIVKTDNECDYDVMEKLRDFIDLLPHASWIKTESKIIGE